MFEGFEQQEVKGNGTTINLVQGGNGPPVLMLHGYPQTHAMWNKIAPRLAEDFTVVCPDLRGYGDSGKVEGDPEHLNYSKRTMAQDQVDVMQQLGFDKFFLVGHDRGGRVSNRLTKDHPDSVLNLTTLDIIPTRTMFQIVDKDFATNTYHWFFLIQPFDFPERVIGADPEFYAGRGFNRVKDADKVFKTLISDAPSHARIPTAKANRAIALSRQDDHEAALELIAQIKPPELDAPLRASVLYEQAWCLRALGKVREAAQTYRKLIKAQPGGQVQAAAVTSPRTATGAGDVTCEALAVEQGAVLGGHCRRKDSAKAGAESRVSALKPAGPAQGSGKPATG